MWFHWGLNAGPSAVKADVQAEQMTGFKAKKDFEH